MVADAETQLRHTRYSSRARFVQGDGLVPKPYMETGHGFDVVTGAWFLNYAKDANQLTSMFRTVPTNLKSGGVFVGICLHPADDVASFASASDGNAWARTGVRYQYREELPGGIGYRLQVFGLPQPGSSGVNFGCYHLNKSIYEESVRAGGMRGRQEWRNCEFLGEEWWREVGLDGNEQGWRKLRECP